MAGVLALVSTGGGTAFLAQIAGEQGRKKQAKLWEKWGGPPTTSLLRHSGNSNRRMVQSWRAGLQAATGHVLPVEAEEDANPEEADEEYEAAIAKLRELRRDRKRFPLVAEEGVSYGFRRNVWGLKWVGLGASLFCSACGWALLYLEVGSFEWSDWHAEFVMDPSSVVAIRFVSAVVSALAAVMWIAVVKESWVKAAAVAYAERLLDSVLKDDKEARDADASAC